MRGDRSRPQFSASRWARRDRIGRGVDVIIGSLYKNTSRGRIVFLVAARSAVGEWLSLVEHLVRDQGVGGSNPLSPTNLFKHLNCTSGFPSTSMVSIL